MRKVNRATGLAVDNSNDRPANYSFSLPQEERLYSTSLVKKNIVKTPWLAVLHARLLFRLPEYRERVIQEMPAPMRCRSYDLKYQVLEELIIKLHKAQTCKLKRLIREAAAAEMACVVSGRVHAGDLKQHWCQRAQEPSTASAVASERSVALATLHDAAWRYFCEQSANETPAPALSTRTSEAALYPENLSNGLRAWWNHPVIITIDD